MPRRPIKLKSPVSVGAGQTAFFDLSPVDIYHGLLLTYTTTTAGGPTAANMDTELPEFRLNVNGTTQRRFSHNELRRINAVKGQVFSDGLININFSEPWRRTVDGEDALAWPMGDLGIGGSFQLEIDIFNNAAQVPTLKGIAEKDFGDAAMGPVVKWKKFNIPVAAVGEHQWSELPRTDSVYALHCFSGDVTSIKIETDGIIRYDLTKAEADELMLKQGFVPDAGIFSVMFDYTGRHLDALSLIDPRTQRPFKEIVITFTMSAANPFNLVAELLGPRD